MLLHNKKGCNIVVKIGEKIEVFQKNAIKDIPQDVASMLMKMYPSGVSAVKETAPAPAAPAPAANSNSNKGAKNAASNRR